MTRFFRKKGGKNRHLKNNANFNKSIERYNRIVKMALGEKIRRKPIKFESYTFDIKKQAFKKDKKPPKVIKKADRETNPAEQVGERTQKPHQFKDPFKNAGQVRVIDQQKICRERKERRKEIMKRTGGKGLSIKKAQWTEISKLVRCN